ncbi:ATP binding [Puccinia graminis f. sp. tritici]|uniref:mitogen-activated protein kinase kinase kinase n=1 Tax=Puccinia graminis f. sp. tritici TaxID=56615 RepID=A0A5B0PD92_PUCGR|nr:ATP binding [Puccinia graminis f. sp. tritici]KAA1099567.1 ATP binding [Puccinia graminis f. sp. tritici]
MAKGQIRPRPPSLVLSRSHSLSKKSPKSSATNNNNNNNNNTNSPTNTQSTSDRIPPTPPFPPPSSLPTPPLRSPNQIHNQPLPPPPPGQHPLQLQHNLSRQTSLNHNHPSPGPTQPTTGTFIDFLRTWDDQHVARWLTDIKLPHLAPIFAENDIIGDILLDVDQSALKEMGVTKVGDRVKLVVAVKDLKQRCVREREQRLTPLGSAQQQQQQPRPHHPLLNNQHHHHHHHHHHPTPSAPRSVPNLYQQAQAHSVSPNSFSSSTNHPHNWNLDQSTSSTSSSLDHTNQSLPAHLSPARSRSGSLRQPPKSIPPPLRLAERLEGLPRAYQSANNSASSRSQPTSTTTTSTTTTTTQTTQSTSGSLPPNPTQTSSQSLLPPLPQIPPSSRTANLAGPSPRSGGNYNSDFALPQHPTNQQQQQQQQQQHPTSANSNLVGTPPSSEYLSASDRGRSRRNRLATDPGSVLTPSPSPIPSTTSATRHPAVWNGDFGLPRAPAPGNLGSALTRKTSMATNSSSSSSGAATPPAVPVSQTSLFLKKSDHRRAPSLNSTSIGSNSKPISIVPSPGNNNPSSSNTVASSSPTSTGSPSRGLNTGTLPGSNPVGLTCILEDGTAGNLGGENGSGRGGGGMGEIYGAAGPREIGFKVGRGGFGRPTTAAGTVGVVAGTTSQIGPVCQPTLDEVIRKTIKVTLAENGIMKTINVENLKSAVDLLDRVLRKFGNINASGQASAGRSVNLDDWALSPMPLNAVPGELNWGTIKQLDENELLELCRTTNRPERQRGLLLHYVATGKRANRKAASPYFGAEEIVVSGVSPTMSPTIAGSSPTLSAHQQSKQEIREGVEPLTGADEGGSMEGKTKPDIPAPRKTRNRASVVSVMSGLMIDPSRHSEPLPPDYQASLQQHGSHNHHPEDGVSGGTAAGGGGERVTSLLASGRGKLRNFFGHRPPSEIISNHLVDYFPSVENKKHLSKTVRQSVRKSMAIRRSSQFSNNNNLAGGGGGGGNGGRTTSWDMSSYPSLPLQPQQQNHPGRLSTDSNRSTHITASKSFEERSSPHISIADFSETSEPMDRSRASLDTLNSLPDPAISNNRLSTRKQRDSDLTSILTLDEVTAEVENRRLSIMALGVPGLLPSKSSSSSVSDWGSLSGLLTSKNPSDPVLSSTDDPSNELDDRHSHPAGGHKPAPTRRSLSSTRIQDPILEENEASDTLKPDGRVDQDQDNQDEEDDEDDDDEEDDEEDEEEDEDDDDDDEDDDDEDDEDDDDEENKDANDDPQKMTSSGSKASIKWVRGALIGQGSFGSVYLGMHALNGTLMAVKQVERPSGTSHNEERKKSMLGALVREIEFLKELQHTNIVQYLDSSADNAFFNIFLEYVPGGSVSTLLKNYGSFEEALVNSFTRQILDGLIYLHSKEIIHRDIKGANILVDNKGVIKISDFGISKRVEDNLLSTARIHRPSLQGSVFWMAPEVVKQTSYTRKADIWSLGCLIVEMLTGEHPWASLTQMQAIFRIGSFATPEIPDDISEECIDLLKQTFLIDHHARPTAMELSNHAFFRSEEGGGGGVVGKAETSVEKGGANREKEGEAEKKEQVQEAHEAEESRGKSEEEGGGGAVDGEKELEVSEDGKTDTDSIIENEARCLVDEANLELSRRKSALANQ